VKEDLSNELRAREEQKAIEIVSMKEAHNLQLKAVTDELDTVKDTCQDQKEKLESQAYAENESSKVVHKLSERLDELQDTNKAYLNQVTEMEGTISHLKNHQIGMCYSNPNPI
jgi:uncharacterized coiled-coil DUF342 family protein